jgi:hypothetical protein
MEKQREKAAKRMQRKLVRQEEPSTSVDVEVENGEEPKPTDETETSGLAE